MFALLYYDFFRLERQRAVLDDELVATKEELLFIRAQLQVRFYLHVCVFSSGILIETFLLTGLAAVNRNISFNLLDLLNWLHWPNWRP